MSAQLQQFFKTCDPEGTRSVDREAFRDLCSRLNIATEDADVIFEDLDHDRDGRISFTDFSRGFSNFISTTEACEISSIQDHEPEIDSGNTEEATKQHVWTTLTNEAERVGKKNSDEGKLKWLAERTPDVRAEVPGSLLGECRRRTLGQLAPTPGRESEARGHLAQREDRARKTPEENGGRTRQSSQRSRIENAVEGTGAG
ncbi:EF-hand domain-containing protein [Caerostris extrusa]|uniref:EF-hand domain-containing protein n=1 Tax=Caerostris extrusa TaxID=172846 RepID=A0AAV4M9G7_CAEEX|nr:EF-hand domain-containing protein [Caerostris extrusa]